MELESASPSESDEEREVTARDETDIIGILSVGHKFAYNAPSFPAFTAMVRPMRYQHQDEAGIVCNFDGFIRDCPALDRAYPALAAVDVGCPNAFFIEVSL